MKVIIKSALNYRSLPPEALVRELEILRSVLLHAKGMPGPMRALFRTQYKALKRILEQQSHKTHAYEHPKTQ